MLSSEAGAQEVSGPMPIGSPADWITPDDYPPSAIRAGAEGRVVTNLGVDRAGKVTSCAVQATSGNAALDAATCAVMTTRGTFTPAKDAGGRATPSTYDLPVRWELPSEPTATVEITEATRLNSDAVIELRLDGDGKVIGCRLLEVVLPSYADSAGDACEEFQVGTQMGPALRRNGKPVASIMVHRLTTRVTTAPQSAGTRR